MTTDILLGDCFSLMKQKENESIDLILPRHLIGIKEITASRNNGELKEPYKNI